MRKFLPVIFVFAGFWLWERVRQPAPAPAPVSVPVPALVPDSDVAEPAPLLAPVQESFSCDGRQYCSQMTSCAEATYFLRNCPNVKMDGNNDGVPCERQWCR